MLESITSFMMKVSYLLTLYLSFFSLSLSLYQVMKDGREDHLIDGREEVHEVKVENAAKPIEVGTYVNFALDNAKKLNEKINKQVQEKRRNSISSIQDYVFIHEIPDPAFRPSNVSAEDRLIDDFGNLSIEEKLCEVPAPHTAFYSVAVASPASAAVASALDPFAAAVSPAAPAPAPRRIR